MNLNENGQCCGRKPLVYKRPHHYKICLRCDSEFDPETGEQVENWAWRQTAAGVFEQRAFDPDRERQRQEK